MTNTDFRKMVDDIRYLNNDKHSLTWAGIKGFASTFAHEGVVPTILAGVVAFAAGGVASLVGSLPFVGIGIGMGAVGLFAAASATVVAGFIGGRGAISEINLARIANTDIDNEISRIEKAITRKAHLEGIDIPKISNRQQKENSSKDVYKKKITSDRNSGSEYPLLDSANHQKASSSRAFITIAEDDNLLNDRSAGSAMNDNINDNVPSTRIRNATLKDRVDKHYNDISKS